MKHEFSTEDAVLLIMPNFSVCLVCHEKRLKKEHMPELKVTLQALIRKIDEALPPFDFT